MVVLLVLYILSVVSLGNGRKIEATHGENVTLFFPVEELEKMDIVRIFFTGEGKKEDLIAKCRCHNQRCDPVEKAGVSLRVKGGNVTLTLQHVNRSTNTGLYEAQIFIGKNVIERKITLVVNDPPTASTCLPGPISSPKPPDSHDRRWLFILLALFVIVVLILGGFILNKYRKDLKPSADFEAANESLMSSGQVSTKILEKGK